MNNGYSIQREISFLSLADLNDLSSYNSSDITSSNIYQLVKKIDSIDDLDSKDFLGKALVNRIKKILIESADSVQFVDDVIVKLRTIFDQEQALSNINFDMLTLDSSLYRSEIIERIKMRSGIIDNTLESNNVESNLSEEEKNLETNANEFFHVPVVDDLAEESVVSNRINEEEVEMSNLKEIEKVNLEINHLNDNLNLEGNETIEQIDELISHLEKENNNSQEIEEKINETINELRKLFLDFVPIEVLENEKKKIRNDYLNFSSSLTGDAMIQDSITRYQEYERKIKFFDDEIEKKEQKNNLVNSLNTQIQILKDEQNRLFSDSRFYGVTYSSLKEYLELHNEIVNLENEIRTNSGKAINKNTLIGLKGSLTALKNDLARMNVDLEMQGLTDKELEKYNKTPLKIKELNIKINNLKKLISLKEKEERMLNYSNLNKISHEEITQAYLLLNQINKLENELSKIKINKFFDKPYEELINVLNSLKSRQQRMGLELSALNANELIEYNNLATQIKDVEYSLSLMTKMSELETKLDELEEKKENIEGNYDKNMTDLKNLSELRKFRLAYELIKLSAFNYLNADSTRSDILEFIEDYILENQLDSMLVNNSTINYSIKFEEELINEIEEFLRRRQVANNVNDINANSVYNNSSRSVLNSNEENEQIGEVPETEEEISQIENKEFNTKLLFRGLAGVTGFATGMFLASVPGVGTIRMVMAGTKLAVSAINVYTNKYPESTISIIMDATNNKLSNEFPNIVEKIKLVKAKLKESPANWFVNGVAAGYITGNLIEIGQNILSNLNEVSKVADTNIAETIAQENIVDESNKITLNNGITNILNNTDNVTDKAFGIVDNTKDVADKVVDVVEHSMPENILGNVTDVIDINPADITLNPGDVIDVSNIEYGLVSANSMSPVHLKNSIGENVVVDKFVKLGNKTMVHLKQINGQGYAWFNLEDIQKTLADSMELAKNTNLKR